MRLAPLLGAVRRVASYATLSQRLREEPTGEGFRFSVLEAAKPALIAALHGELQRPVLVLVSRLARARQLADELSSWSEWPERVLLFPELDTLPYERMAPGAEQLAQRLAVLLTLARETAGPSLVVASARGATDRIMGPGALRASSWDLVVGQPIQLDRLLREWLRAGYEAVPVVAGPGEFARRGGIVDVAPLGTQQAAVRIELDGDVIASLRTIDLTTQRSGALLESVLIGPGHEVSAQASPEGLSLLEGLTRDHLQPRIRQEMEEEIGWLSRGQAFPMLEFYRGVLGTASIFDHLPDGSLVLVDDPGLVGTTAREIERQAEVLAADLLDRGEVPAGVPPPYWTWEQLGERWRSARRLDLVLDPEASPAGFTLPPSYSGRLPELIAEAAARSQLVEGARNDRDGAEPAVPSRLVIVSQQAARLEELLHEQGVAVQAVEALEQGLGDQLPSLALVHGGLAEGWANEGIGVVVITDREMFGWAKVRRGQRGRVFVTREPFVSDLEPGELVVHIDHGIGRFRGLVRLADQAAGAEREYLDLEYSERARLRVPIEHADRVSRYVGAGEANPPLNRLGTGDWQRTKRRIRSAVHRIARELVELYATRELARGLAFGPDTQWQWELEASFPYVETPDQLEAVREVKAGMEEPTPMDRLIVGDVGYGKTEVALRAAFKAVMEGKQVAVLVPTTVLAQQHYGTFRERLAPFPVQVEVLSRFLTDRQARAVVQGIRDGSVDIVIGTHRLLQPDVAFKDLGLLIIDEEQRFGVVHKERFKQFRTEVHVLTLSATPIPRTLHLSLVGVRDLSMMQTAPEDRLPIRTYVTEQDDTLVREAILRELDRGGQVYYVANRVRSIQWVANQLQALVPEARIGIGHGQMPDEELELAMLDFVNGEQDVLICTTIIEAGLDLPNVNTIIVTDAQLFGLAQLYQLRGRVGRGANRAYAYFLYPRDRALSEVAEKRLRAIFEASGLGAGYQIALKDLEIRGAGNLLGFEQHGHISAVGFDLYCRLLGEAVDQLKKLQRLSLETDGMAEKLLAEVFPEERLPAVSLPVRAFLPVDYIAEEAVRLNLYQRLAAAQREEPIRELREEIEDRFGSLPEPAEKLVAFLLLRAAAAAAGIAEIAVDGRELVLRFHGARALDAADLSRRLGVAVRAHQNQLRLDYRPEEDMLALVQQLVEQLLAPVVVAAE